jgi:DNA-binding XRE family transcriptional regulator
MQQEKVLIRIGEKLKRLRVAAGYKSYETFAWDHNLNRMQYWRMEKGTYNITIKSLVKVLDIHKNTIEEFFTENL